MKRVFEGHGKYPAKPAKRIFTNLYHNTLVRSLNLFTSFNSTTTPLMAAQTDGGAKVLGLLKLYTNNSFRQVLCALDAAVSSGHAAEVASLLSKVHLSEQEAAHLVRRAIDVTLAPRPRGVYVTDTIATLNALFGHCPRKIIDDALLTACGGAFVQVDVVRAILGAKANPNTTNPSGQTPLDMIVATTRAGRTTADYKSSNEALSAIAHALIGMGAVPLRTDISGISIMSKLSCLTTPGLARVCCPWYGVMTALRSSAMLYLDTVRNELVRYFPRELAYLITRCLRDA